MTHTEERIREEIAKLEAELEELKRPKVEVRVTITVDELRDIVEYLTFKTL